MSVNLENLISAIDSRPQPFISTDLCKSKDAATRNNTSSLLCYLHRIGVIQRVGMIGKSYKYVVPDGKTAREIFRQVHIETKVKKIGRPRIRPQPKKEELSEFLLGKLW